MFRNVLVGVSDDEGSRDAVALAKALIAPDGELTLGHVYRDDPPGPRDWSDPDLPDKRTEARALLERISTEAGGQPLVRWLGASSVGRGLHELAEAIEADLLVVGSSRHALVGRARLPDDTQAALNGAPCAIAVAPDGYSSEAPALLREIGVAYDGSPESQHALGVARTLAAERGSKVSAFHAVSLPMSIYLGAPARVKVDTIKRLVRSAHEHIAAQDGVEAHAAYGDPVEELTLYSASLDLLIVGSRSYGPLGRLVHGSTAQHLARTARCPLLVLTRAARKALPLDGTEDRREVGHVLQQ